MTHPLHQPRFNNIGTLRLLQIVLPAVFTLSPLADRAWAEDCLVWLKREEEDVGSYGQRVHHAMAYDSHRGVVVFFGGEIGEDGEQAYFNDTQEYNGMSWKPISTAVKPPARSHHSMVYDPIRRKVILFGGGNRVDDRHHVTLDDTWVYSSDGDNGFWEQMPRGEHRRSSIGGHGMIWDSSSEMVLLHGGAVWPFDPTRVGIALGINPGTFAWNGAGWIESGTGPRIWGFGMVFDTKRAVSIVYGGFTLNFEEGWTAAVWENDRRRHLDRSRSRPASPWISRHGL